MSATANDADAEIIEVFVEEAGEVLENIDRHLAALHGRPGDAEALKELRRGFHTLKGSGRMVKALDLGELSWRVENMLNRAIEGKIAVDENLTNLVGSVRAAIPPLVQAFEARRAHGMEQELEGLMAGADALASGRAAPAARTASAAPVPGGAQTQPGGIQAGELQAGEIGRRLERFSARADEALHRSEMALQSVRRLTKQIDALGGAQPGQISRAELNPVIERVNALTRELIELRQLAKRPAAEPSPSSRDIHQMIDQQTRGRSAALDRLRGDMDTRIARAEQAAAAGRRLGLYGLLIGAIGLVAAGAALALLLL